MQAKPIAHGVGDGSSTPVDASASPWHRGNTVVAVCSISLSGGGGNHIWVVEGNNEPPENIAIWVELTEQFSEEHTHFRTITMPRQIRLTKVSGSSGTKVANLTILGED